MTVTMTCPTSTQDEDELRETIELCESLLSEARKKLGFHAKKSLQKCGVVTHESKLNGVRTTCICREVCHMCAQLHGSSCKLSGSRVIRPLSTNRQERLSKLDRKMYNFNSSDSESGATLCGTPNAATSPSSGFAESVWNSLEISRKGSSSGGSSHDGSLNYMLLQNPHFDGFWKAKRRKMQRRNNYEPVVDTVLGNGVPSQEMRCLVEVATHAASVLELDKQRHSPVLIKSDDLIEGPNSTAFAAPAVVIHRTDYTDDNVPSDNVHSGATLASTHSETDFLELTLQQEPRTATVSAATGPYVLLDHRYTPATDHELSAESNTTSRNSLNWSQDDIKRPSAVTPSFVQSINKKTTGHPRVALDSASSQTTQHSKNEELRTLRQHSVGDFSTSSSVDDLDSARGGIDMPLEEVGSIESLDKFSHRASWLVGLLILQSTSSFILKAFDGLLATHPVVVYFLTMLIGAGGNAGSQSTVLAIRGLALGTLNRQTRFQFVVRQLTIGLFLAVLLFVTSFLRVYLFDADLFDVLAVCTSMFAIVITSVFLGSIIPLGLKACHIDPAHAGDRL
eukprot:Lankesteria_metandrocarpae@DN5263_c0_g1_i3.p2